MAVNLLAPDPASLSAIAGVELGFAYAGIRKAQRRDLMLMRFAPGTRVAGVFTQNSFAAAPVQVCRERIHAGTPVSALVVNAGNANCGTGAQGLAAARQSCAAAARLLNCAAEAVLPFSTGVILEHLPVERIEAALPDCVKSLAADHWAQRRIGQHDHRRQAGARYRHCQGCGHAATEYGDHAGLPRHRRRGGAAAAAAHGERSGRRFV
jgi:glutamate N-acetyltransferase / amino-acid N-acetyltransferase